MNLKIQRKIVGKILKCSPKKVIFDNDSLETIKESITRVDLKNQMKKGLVGKRITAGQSRGRIRKNALQKSRGQRKGHGSRKGKNTARGDNAKTTWINHIRKQRKFIKVLKDKNVINKEEYRQLYRKSNGGFFRSVRHIKIFLEDVLSKKEIKKE
jgi:large subunit ribosomal protein L19e